jgi:Rod binding domain-containing protein
MEINSNNLINTEIFKTNEFDNIETKNLEDEKLREVCDSFESYFLNQIMDISLKNTKVAGESPGSDIVKGMYIQSIADNSSGTLGISNMLYEFLSKENNK